VAAAKIHFEEQALVVGTKQSRQANKATRPTSQADQQGSWACLLCFGSACFVLSLLLALALPNGFCTKKYTLSNKLFSDICGFDSNQRPVC
jgi:hypothetical protein